MIRVAIQPNELLDREALLKTFQLTAACVRQAQQSGELRSKKVAGRLWYRGQDVLDWLTFVPSSRPSPTGNTSSHDATLGEDEGDEEGDQ